MHKHCIACGNNKFLKSKILGLLECGHCGFLTADVTLSFEDLQELYSRNYFCGEEYADYQRDKEIIQKDFEKRLYRMNALIDNPEQKTLFEIGCAYGFFIEIAKKLYSIVSGIDISEDAIKYAISELGLDVKCGDYLKEKIEPCHVICIWDTIEHLSAPELYIQKAYADLVDGGIICITTGDAGSLLAKMRGKRWRQIHPPTHLHYFSKKTLSAMLRRSGFEIIDISYPSKLISLNTFFYTILCLKSHHKKLYEFLGKIKVNDINVNINLHDFMFIIARKGRLS